MKRIILIGAGGHGRVVGDTAACLGYEQIEFLDDNWPQAQKNGVWPVIGAPDTENLTELAESDFSFFVSIGQNSNRQTAFKKLGDATIPMLVHPSAIISKFATIGAGSIVVAGAVVNAFASIGTGVILNTGCTIDHDCEIDDFAHISPGANLAGGVKIGARTWVGIGAAVREGVVIGKDVMIGAGAVVVKDVADGSKVMGVPARNL